MKPLLIFDLDGTLADTSFDLIAALNAVLADCQRPAVALEMMQDRISQGAVGLLRAGFGADYEQLSEEKKQILFDNFVHYYEQGMLTHVALYPGVEAALNKLSEQGFKMAICSNKNTLLAKQMLQYLGIHRHFPVICGGDFFKGIKKPDGRHVAGTMARSGFSPSEACAIFIGDAMSDMAAAKQVGIPSIFVTYGYADITPNESGAMAIVNDAAQIPEAISSVAGCLMLARNVS